MSVTKWRFFLHRLDGHKNVGNNVGSFDTKMSVTKWRVFPCTGSMSGGGEGGGDSGEGSARGESGAGGRRLGMHRRP